MFDRMKRYLWRRRNPVLFDQPDRLEPVSRFFGVDRGTPIDRFFIERFLDAHRADIRGRVLEIGESLYSRRYGSAVEAFEVLHADASEPQATLTGDLASPETLPEGWMDCFICTQTFNFIYDVRAAAASSARVLKPGGVLLGSVGGLSQISRYDMERWGDYWRFTDLSLRKLLEAEFREVEIEICGNLALARAFLDGCCVEDLGDFPLFDTADPDYQIVLCFRGVK